MHTTIILMSITMSFGQASRQSPKAVESAHEKVVKFIKLLPQLQNKPIFAHTYISRNNRIKSVRAKHCLIHIRDMHGNPKMKPIQKVAMFAAQKAIYEIVEYFMNEPAIKLKRIYKEGVTIENEKAVNNKDESINQIDMAGSEIRDIISSNNRFQHESATIRIDKRLLEIDFTDNELFYLSAAFQLHKNKGLYMEAAESKVANITATRTNRNSEPRNYYQRQEEIYDNRELLLLELIRKNGDAIAFTIYGGGHDFDKEIDIWNKKHPDDMFCLVEITPRPYYEYYILSKIPKMEGGWPPRNN